MSRKNACDDDQHQLPVLNNKKTLNFYPFPPFTVHVACRFLICLVLFSFPRLEAAGQKALITLEVPTTWPTSASC